jgi:hypothetical protein
MGKFCFLMLAFIMMLVSPSCVKDTKLGCKDTLALNYDEAADDKCVGCCKYPPKGTVLFWTKDASMINYCGVITVTLSNGMVSNITNSYSSIPTNCDNAYGGTFSLDKGNYTYTVAFSNGSCIGKGGSITVGENSCNMIMIQ